MQFKKVSEIAVEKLMCELKDDLGKISSKSDLTSSTLFPNLKEEEQLFLIGKK